MVVYVQGLMILLQNLPTQNWTNSHISLLVAEAYRLKFMFADAPNHLQTGQSSRWHVRNSWTLIVIFFIFPIWYTLLLEFHDSIIINRVLLYFILCFSLVSRSMYKLDLIQSVFHYIVYVICTISWDYMEVTWTGFNQRLYNWSIAICFDTCNK